MRHAFALGVLALAGAAFAQYGGFQPGVQPGLPNPVWTTVSEGQDCKITRPQTVILSNQGDWERHYRAMCGIPNNVQVNVPAIANWQNEDVAIVHLGQVNTVGYRVYVETVVRTGAIGLGVRWVTLTPPTNTRLAQTVSSPFCIVKIQRMAGNYEFIGRTMVNPFTAADNWGCTAPAWRFGPGGLTPLNNGGGHGHNPPAWRFGPGGLTPLETGGQKDGKGNGRGDKDDDRRGGGKGG